LGRQAILIVVDRTQNEPRLAILGQNDISLGGFCQKLVRAAASA
jgi:hypothetical protein